MDAIHYGFGGIAAAAADIQGASGTINGLLDDLRARIEPMVATWDGESSEAYQVAQRQWDQAAADLNMVLATISRTVDEGNDRMSDVNRRAAASWG